MEYKKYVLPKLFAKSKTGKTKEWETWVENVDNIPTIFAKHGYENGKKQLKTKAVPKGKNVGRSNETTPWDQACKDALSKWKKQLDKGYVEDINDYGTSDIFLPMLAHKYKERKKYLSFPCAVQPKLNGIRMTSTIKDDKLYLLTRKGKEFKFFDHLYEELRRLLVHIPRLDGEVFNRSLTFQQIASIARRTKNKHENSEYLQYWVYDCYIDGNTPFSKRNSLLQHVYRAESEKKPFKYLKLVTTRIANNEDEIEAWHKRYMKAEYEGTILRNVNGMYLKLHRSNDLLKYKDFQDSEYEIIGAKSEVEPVWENGQLIKTWNKIVFKCKTSKGKEFDCRIKGTREYRQELWEKKDELVGKELTVRYQELSKDEVPIFPVGIEVRDYE